MGCLFCANALVERGKQIEYAPRRFIFTSLLEHRHKLMSMKSFVLGFFVFCSISLLSQTTEFRKNYDQVAFLRDGVWGEWQAYYTTVIFNFQDTPDIRMYATTDANLQGYVFTSFTRLGEISEITLDDGVKAQQSKYIDSGGIVVTIQVYLGGLKVITDTYIMQLSEEIILK